MPESYQCAVVSLHQVRLPQVIIHYHPNLPCLQVAVVLLQHAVGVVQVVVVLFIPHQSMIIEELVVGTE